MHPAPPSTPWPWPAPGDDGAAAHLTPGFALPDMALPATPGDPVNLGRRAGRAVVFVYPWTGRAGLANPPDWDHIAGAHGSTPQAEGFAKLAPAFAQRGCAVFGLSSQDSAHHWELSQRLGLPFPLLSDAGFAFARALNLPTFQTGGVTYLKRLTLVVENGRIVTAHYPVHPPDRSAWDALALV